MEPVAMKAPKIDRLERLSGSFHLSLTLARELYHSGLLQSAEIWRSRLYPFLNEGSGWIHRPKKNQQAPSIWKMAPTIDRNDRRFSGLKKTSNSGLGSQKARDPAWYRVMFP
jgi:hypothetical protein